MTDETQSAPQKPRSRWWSILLVASLALNLLFAGAIAARWFTQERVERLTGGSYTQLLPRRFLADLPRERRQDILAMLGAHRKAFRDGRTELRNAAVAIAAALEAEPYNADAAAKALDDFNAVASGLVTKGSDVARQVLATLSPEERKKLAQRIRERARGSRGD